MKRRLVSMLIVMICLITAAIPVSASNEGNLYLFGRGLTDSTGLLEGRYIDTLYLNNFTASSDEVYYSVTDQNNELVLYGWLQPNSAISYNGNTNTVETTGRASFFRNSWNPTPSSALNLTMTCSGTCDASGYIYLTN